jgi:preprotein translocase subunit SecE
MWKEKGDEMRRVKWVLGKHLHRENLIITINH